MPHYVIHIGPHKTGTTYLQRSFERMRPALRARRIEYPACWSGTDGHHHLVEQLWDSEDSAAWTEFQRLNSSRFDTVLLSSETLSYLTEADIRRLHVYLDGAPVTVVFYARRWSELLPSCWREMVKHGSLATLPEFVLSCLGDAVASNVVNFATVLDRWATVFGTTAVRLASYNGVLDAGEDLLTHFCRSFLAWPDVPPSDVGRVNLSLDMVDTEMIRVLNALEWTRAREGRQRLYHRFMAVRDHLPVRWIVEHSMQYIVDTVWINDAAPALAHLHDRILAQFRPIMVPPLPGGRLFTPRRAEVPFIRPDHILVDGALDRFREIQARLLAC